LPSRLSASGEGEWLNAGRVVKAEETVQDARTGPLAWHPEGVPEPQPHRQVHRGQLVLFGPSPSERERQDEIIGFGPLQPVRRQSRELLVMGKPPKRPNEMTDSEIDRWAGQLVDGMAQAIDRR